MPNMKILLGCSAEQAALDEQITEAMAIVDGLPGECEEENNPNMDILCEIRILRARLDAVGLDSVKLWGTLKKLSTNTTTFNTLDARYNDLHTRFKAIEASLSTLWSGYKEHVKFSSKKMLGLERLLNEVIIQLKEQRK